ncbi:MAG: DNA repair protein RecN [Pseudomonadota bacterium]
MLTALHITDFVLIDTFSAPLGNGLTVLTGETGAGKSILLEALGLAVGGRSSRGGVRDGSEQGVVTAVFEPGPDHEAWRLLRENGVRYEDDQILLKRIQSGDGRSRAFVNDQPVSIALLKEIGGTLLEIHGQHDGRGFLSAATHRTLLDEYGSLGDTAEGVSSAWQNWKELARDLKEKQATAEKASQERDYLRHVIDELEALNPDADEEELLASRRAHLIAAEKVAEDLSAAERLLSENALEGDLSACARRLSKAAAQFDNTENPLTDALSRIESALSEVMEARAAIEDAGARLEFDVTELERAEERLFALRASARKHNVEPRRLPEILTAAKQTIDALEEDQAGFSDLKKRVRAAEATYHKRAKALSAGRLAAASRLDAAVVKELAPLKLAHAVFETMVRQDTEHGSADGYDHVEFMVSTNPGTLLGPLKTIASGGELSRFVLAMKAALAAKENRTVIIFDEVDAGVGGAVADAVGERLHHLAGDAQVLVVTHSPQVAARGTAHWLVSKSVNKGKTRTDIVVLDMDERVEEIARMLSGATITTEARAAATSLLSPLGTSNQSGNCKVKRHNKVNSNEQTDTPAPARRKRSTKTSVRKTA